MSMHASAPGAGGRLWAITSYFNPVGYRRRLEHYREFRRRLRVPLVTVELAYREEFDLAEGDADVLIRLRSRDVLWQKERLLNIALEALPDECDAVAWIDCDIVFENERWAETTLRALDEHVLVQPFERIHFLPPDASARGRPRPEGTKSRDALAARILRGTLPDDIFLFTGGSLIHGYAPGNAWAARRDLLDEHGLYDALILGCGDKAMYCAAYGKIDEAVGAIPMNEAQAAHFRAWAVPFHRSVAGRVGFIDVDAEHLWHGKLTDRRYGDRYKDFAVFRFDPTGDIVQDENGVWRWNSPKEEMHRFVLDYFHARREDV